MAVIDVGWGREGYQACKAAGGQPTVAGRFGTAESQTHWNCIIPDKPTQAPAPPAPAQIYVNTQVSPQISPVFQQQFQPSNSPMTGATTQTSGQAAPAQPSGQAAPVAPPTPVPSTVPAPAQYVEQAAPVATPAPAGYSYPVTTNTSGTSEITTPAPAPVFDWKTAAILGVSGLALILTLTRK